MDFSPHRKAILQALFVTFLWSLSWVMIKIGLHEIPALTFAGLRYFLAFLMLLPLTLRYRYDIEDLTRQDWRNLLVLGVIYYAITQGGQFLALTQLPAVTLSLMLNFTAALTGLLGIYFLNERLTRQQWVGIGIFLIGVMVYFYPVNFPATQVLALIVGMVCVLSNSASGILGRFVNRGGRIPAVVVTVVSMGIGSSIMLVAGILTEGIPQLSPSNWIIIFWLALVNTALAFTLWNHTMRTLSAVESSIINNTMLLQIAVLAWIFLGESITSLEIVGLAIAIVGILLFQLRVFPRLSELKKIQRSHTGD